VTTWVVTTNFGGSVSVEAIGASAPSATVPPTTTTADGSTSSSTSLPDTTTTTVGLTPTTAAAKAPPPTASPAPDQAVLEAAAKRFCSLSTDYPQQIRLIQISLTNPARLRELMQVVGPKAAESVTVASKEMQPDAANLSSTLDSFGAALDKADYQLAMLPPDMVMLLQSPPVQGALDRIEDFARKAC